MAEQITPYWDKQNLQLQGPGNIPHGSTEILPALQPTGQTQTIPMGIATRSGKIVDVRAGAIQPAGGNDTLTVDIRKNGSTILTSVLNLSSAQAARQSVVGALNALGLAPVAVGDWFEAVITYTHGTGTAPTNVLAQVQLILN